jgi:hypothetical protein
MTAPTLPSVSINQNYVSTTIVAFGDTISGSTVPPTCLARTCTSSSPNVVWNSAGQLFTVKTLGISDVLGTSTVTLSCFLASYIAVNAMS